MSSSREIYNEHWRRTLQFKKHNESDDFEERKYVEQQTSEKKNKVALTRYGE